MPPKEKKKDNHIDFEIEFYQKVVIERPNFVEALIALGDLYTKKGLINEGLKVDERLSKLKPDDPLILYNLACSYSLLGNNDLAFDAIKKAIHHGYDDFSHLKKDQDLENLRRDPRFQGLLDKIERTPKKP
ncbi:MAG: hypothetical protein ABIJ41_08340 [Candidatus Omnitrophota bacterium]